MGHMVGIGEQGGLGSLLCVDVEIDPNPKEYGTVRSPDGFGSTQEPPIPPFGVTTSKSYLARATSTKAGRPDSACLFMILRMQKSNVRIPLPTDVDSETKRMILRQSEVVGNS